MGRRHGIEQAAGSTQQAQLCWIVCPIYAVSLWTCWVFHAKLLVDCFNQSEGVGTSCVGATLVVALLPDAPQGDHKGRPYRTFNPFGIADAIH